MVVRPWKPGVTEDAGGGRGAPGRRHALPPPPPPKLRQNSCSSPPTHLSYNNTRRQRGVPPPPQREIQTPGGINYVHIKARAAPPCPANPSRPHHTSHRLTHAYHHYYQRPNQPSLLPYSTETTRPVTVSCKTTNFNSYSSLDPCSMLNGANGVPFRPLDENRQWKPYRNGNNNIISLNLEHIQINFHMVLNNFERRLHLNYLNYISNKDIRRSLVVI